MATIGDGGTGASREPLVGRGSARRVELAASRDEAVEVPARPGDRGPRPRSVPRPRAARSSRGRPWLRAGAQTPRARFALGVVLIAVLASAWLWVGRGGSTPPQSVTATTVNRHAAPAAAEPAVAVPRWVPDSIAATCRARRADTPAVVVVDCTPGRGVVALQYRGFASVAALRTAYAATSPRGGGDGPAACARGATEERSWSEPESATTPTGRYRCSLLEGRARLVWSSERAGAPVLAIASRADRDLRSLYQWWTTVPGPEGP